MTTKDDKQKAAPHKTRTPEGLTVQPDDADGCVVYRSSDGETYRVLASDYVNQGR